jgi:acyl-CoA synthetase (AMP-forming)/AMP-acid ligase II
VAVVGVDSRKWGESPLALVVGDETQADAAALKDWTNERVGRHQRLAGVVFVAELPRNANGKVLKNQLRAKYRNFEAQHSEAGLA